MKRYLTYILFGAALAAGAPSCSLDNKYYYESPDNIYFDYRSDTSKMHIVYSFANTPSGFEHTLEISVKVSGERVSRDRQFRAEVVPSGTTAQAGLHYQSLQSSYTMPSGEGEVILPVLLFNQDPAMEETTLTLTIRLVPTEDFGIEFEILNTIDISFSNRLEEPVWWSDWQDELGTYSRTRHFLFLVATGVDELPLRSEEEAALVATNYARIFKAFVHDPFAWVGKNPEYAIDPVADEDGNPTYVFYLKERPDKTYKLQQIQITSPPNPLTNVFIDENGAMIYFLS